MPFRDAEQYILQNKKEIISLLAEFVLTDTILFWSADEDIKLLQREKWQPIIDFADKEIGINLQKTYEIIPPSENNHCREAFKNYLRTLYLNELTALYLAATELKSVLLAVALVKRKISATEVFEGAFLEEFYQNERWGTDKEAENKREQIKENLLKIEGYIQENG